MSTLAISSASILFALPKLWEKLAANPEGQDKISRIDQLRKHLFVFSEKLKDHIGRPYCYMISEMVIKNLWLATVCSSWLCANVHLEFLPEDTLVGVGALLIPLSVAIGFVRFSISEDLNDTNKDLAKFIFDIDTLQKLEEQA